MTRASGPIMPHIHSQAGHNPYARNWREQVPPDDPGRHVPRRVSDAKKRRNHAAEAAREHREVDFKTRQCECGEVMRGYSRAQVRRLHSDHVDRIYREAYESWKGLTE